MKKVWLAVATSLMLCSPALAYPATVIGVHDGDTITVWHSGCKEHIRLNAIDAPELRQQFGPEARHLLANLVLSRGVDVRPLKQDRYGRTVADVYVNGLCANSAMVRLGGAWWYRQYAPRNTELAALEEGARNFRCGLWQGTAPEPPWVFRHQSRKR